MGSMNRKEGRGRIPNPSKSKSKQHAVFLCEVINPDFIRDAKEEGPHSIKFLRDEG